jgi:holliday junction DNA helicase RuvA
VITRMTGTLNRVLDEEVRLQVGPFEYQVLVPEFVRRQVQLRIGQELALHVTEYLEGNQMSNKLVPRRIGFLAEAELEFFELFCTVERIGTRKALKALVRPVREIADAIQRQDVKWLSTLPGVGGATAEQIITALKKKVIKYARMTAPKEGEAEATPAALAAGQVIEDAYIALLALGLNALDARQKIDLVVAGGQEFKTAEDVLQMVFKQKV